MNKILLTLITLLPATAFAHTGTEITGFTAGILHPLTGLDHLLAMVAVGLWASQIGKKAIWMLPTSFVTVMVLGALLPLFQINLPYVEVGILLSVLVLGGLIAAALPMVLSVVIVGFFGLFHGYAHGIEASTLSATYITGFVLATAILHITGVIVGINLHKLSEKMTRFAGGLIAMTGAYLIFA